MAQLPEDLCLPIVDVLWLDSIGVGGWKDKDYLLEDSLECRTVGFLVCEDDKSIIVSSSLCNANDEHCHSPIRIPKVAIKSYEEIRFV